MVLDDADLDGADEFVFNSKPTHTRDEALGTPRIPLAAYLPESRNGSILITSRSQHVALALTASYGNIKLVPTMDKSQGLQLLRYKLRDTSNEKDAVDLLEALSYTPLAIIRAAADISQRQMTVPGYLKELLSGSVKKIQQTSFGQISGDKSSTACLLRDFVPRHKELETEGEREDRSVGFETRIHTDSGYVSAPTIPSAIKSVEETEDIATVYSDFSDMSDSKVDNYVSELAADLFSKLPPDSVALNRVAGILADRLGNLPSELGTTPPVKCIWM
jgi:hypothetical protein